MANNDDRFRGDGHVLSRCGKKKKAVLPNINENSVSISDPD
jgi:hypothetical protein